MSDVPRERERERAMRKTCGSTALEQYVCTYLKPLNKQMVVLRGMTSRWSISSFIIFGSQHFVFYDFISKLSTVCDIVCDF